MDEYGMCRLDDAPMLAGKLKHGKNIVFSFGDGEVNAYVAMIAPSFEVIGTMPFGGKPSGYVVSLLHHGMYYFTLDSELHPNYIGEKLNLALPMSRHVAEMLNAISEALHTKFLLTNANGVSLREDHKLSGHYAAVNARCHCGEPLLVAPVVLSQDGTKDNPTMVCYDHAIHSFRFSDLVQGRQKEPVTND
ncbi:MAG: hypothetical protein GWN00_19980 [Aliifodinibius sp.]|nr:hypothetical protein [Fodinibius sp.]NIY27001.1 hypothetical protein [Fodinibius sp.]